MVTANQNCVLPLAVLTDCNIFLYISRTFIIFNKLQGYGINMSGEED